MNERKKRSFSTFQSPLIRLKLKKVKLSDLEKMGIIHQSLLFFYFKTTGDFNEVLKRQTLKINKEKQSLICPGAMNQSSPSSYLVAHIMTTVTLIL